MGSRAPRKSEIKRATRETDIAVSLCIDGHGKADIQTGVPFMDHMLTLFTVHGFFDLTITAKGDTEIDDHHTVEDLGICLGRAFKEALGKFDTPLVQEFLRALSLHSGLTLHVEVVHGENTHHILEAIFKSLGRTLDMASSVETRVDGPLSSKGSL